MKAVFTFISTYSVFSRRNERLSPFSHRYSLRTTFTPFFTFFFFTSLGKLRQAKSASPKFRAGISQLQLHSPIVSVERAHIREKFAISANYARMVGD